MDRSRERACQGKVRHRSRALARRERRRLMARGAEDLHVYLCEWCDFFHIGHVSRHYLCSACWEYHRAGECMGGMEAAG